MDVKWIKICVGVFDDEKIKLIEGLPDADAIIVIWFKLLCMAGKENNGGVFWLTDKIAYTDEMLATIFRRPVNTVRLALRTFESYGMIEVVDNVITIPNWSKYQTLDGIDKRKEQNRLYQAKHREKLKQENDSKQMSADSKLTVSNSSYSYSYSNSISNSISYSYFTDRYNEICVKLPKVQKLTEQRKKKIKAYLNTYTEEDWQRECEMANASDFLTGSSGWQANFDWLINTTNATKVLEGNYTNKETPQKKPGECKSYNVDEAFRLALAKTYGEN